MSGVTVRDIVGKVRSYSLAVASVDDFEFGPPRAADAGSELRPGNSWSLYTLDFPSSTAVFVGPVAPGALSEQAFVYEAQYAMAERVLRVPFDDFLAVTEALPSTGDALACLHSVGRCGSTLLARALGRLERVRAYSEPDFLVPLAVRVGRDDDRLERLLRAGLRCLDPTRPGARETVVLKPRSFCTRLAPLLAKCGAAQMFGERSFETWLESAARAFSVPGILEGPGPDPDSAPPAFGAGLDPSDSARLFPTIGEDLRRWIREEVGAAAKCGLVRDIALQSGLVKRLLPDVSERGRERMTGLLSGYPQVRALTLFWVDAMRAARRAREAGAELPSIGYEELRSDSEVALRRVLAGMRLLDRGSGPGWEAALTEFEHDSQRGSALSRVRVGARRDRSRVDPVKLAEANACLASYPV